MGCVGEKLYTEPISYGRLAAMAVRKIEKGPNLLEERYTKNSNAIDVWTGPLNLIKNLLGQNLSLQVYTNNPFGYEPI
jgi:hypothetical protein